MAASLNEYFNEQFGIKEQDIRTFSPLTLAYIGDAVFDVIVRSILVNKGNTAVNKLHVRASSIVKAGTQAMIIKTVMDDLTDEEKDIYRRGRNSKPHTKAKNATTMDYLDATGFEAVIGFLYLKGDMDRVCDIVKIAIEKANLDLLK
ncbi:MAG: ribonuclease III [Butyrivibrio sp.]|uniref:Mini-ribonuclease 3 n=1 Tax=Butyrivibrio sp. TaxID=28121 RepID=UPI001B0F4392|nr:ribonuclease III domain-containing protein [Butyrivibrio sp.]MBO6239883.1 ribonuclease III [Butyrivibrio sp.]